MKLLIIGHSYVSGLESLNISNFTIGNTSIEVKYLYKSGGDYYSILYETDLIEQAVEYEPDFILAIVAGNSIHNNVTNDIIYAQIKVFYKTLRNRLPEAKLMASQVELRFYKANNYHNCPTEAEYTLRRRDINKFLNRLKLKDYLLKIAGPHALDKRSYYNRDGVHLNRTGLRCYFSYIRSVVAYILERQAKKREQEHVRNFYKN